MSDARVQVDTIINDAKTKRNVAEKVMNEAKTKMEEAKTKMEEAKTKMEEAKTKMEEANKIKPYTWGVTAKAEKTFKDNVRDASNNVTDAKQAVTDAEKAVTDAEQAVTDAEQVVTDAKEAVTDAEQAVTDAEQVVEGITKEMEKNDKKLFNLSRLLRQVDTLTKEKTDAETKLYKAKTELQDKKKEKTDAETKLSKAETELLNNTAITNSDNNKEKAVNQQYDTAQKNFTKAEAEFKTKTDDFKKAETDFKNAETDFKEKEKKYKNLIFSRDKLKNDEEMLKKLNSDESFKLNNPLTSAFTNAVSSVLPGFKSKPNATVSNKPAPNASTRKLEKLPEPSKKITITFLQDTDNQFFVESYNSCDITGSNLDDINNNIEKKSGKNDAPQQLEELSKRIVLDESGIVQENVTEIHNNIFAHHCSDNKAQIANGGYDSTRSTIRSVKSRKSTKPRKTSKYSPYNKFMRTTRRRRRL